MKHEIQLGRSVLLHVVACEYVSRFRGPHSGSLDDETSRDDLCSLIGRLPA